jgi:hypothetical protein
MARVRIMHGRFDGIFYNLIDLHFGVACRLDVANPVIKNDILP